MSDAEDDSIGRREVAYRLFAAEFEDSDLSYTEGEDDRSPNYVVTPTGARVNRLFAVGVLTEVEQVSEDVLRGRVVDPTGAFVTYAGQYQPDVQAFLERVETPTFVAMTGKARTFQPEDSDRVFTSVRPESINEVDAETRDRWTVQATEQTLDRVGHAATALALELRGDDLEAALRERGVEEGLAVGIPIALDHYGATPTYLAALRELALDAARLVAGENDEVGELQVAPDEPGSASASDLAGSSVDVPASAIPDGTETAETGTVSQEPSPSEPADTDASTDAEPANDPSTEAVEPSTPEETAESGAAAETTESSSGTAEASESPDDLGDFDSDEFELDEETREQVEEEYGTEFQSGAEVDEPGEADIETPDSPTEEPEETDEHTETPETETVEVGDGQETAEPEPAEEPAAGREAEPDVADQDAGAEPGEPGAGTEPAADGEAGEPDDLQAAVVDLMAELDEGEGASRDELVAEMADRYGVDADATEDAIQEALMSGECYEPSDGTLKPI